MNQTFKAWIEAMRLRTIPVGVSGVVCAMACALTDGYSIDWTGWVCMAFAALCQIASNFANEYYDFRAGRDTPGREGPRRGVTEGDLTPRAMLIATCVCVAIGCALGLSLLIRGGWPMLIVGIFVVFGLFAYSAGPWPLSTHGLGEVAVVIFFGVVPVCVTYYLITMTMSWPVLATSLAVGFLGANVLVVNNYRDIPDDTAVGKRTLAVRYGEKAMLRLYLTNDFLAAILFFPSIYILIGIWAILISLLIVLFGFFATNAMRKEKGRALNPWLGRTAMFMFLISCAFFAISLLS